MARQRQRDICNMEMAILRHGDQCQPGVRSGRELAELAAREVLGCTAHSEIAAAAIRLSQMFSGQVRSVEPDMVREALEAEAARRLCDEFMEWGVPTRL